ncbi:MAG: hypothetical protein R3F35_08810 [Myxococcota bacterium]
MLIATPAFAVEETLYAALTDGSFTGIAVLTPNRGGIDRVAVAGTLSAIAAGPIDTLYGGIGRVAHRFAASGASVDDITGSFATVFPSMAFGR